MTSEDATETRKEGFVSESLDKWAPRFVADGADYNDLERLKGRIESWEDWCAAFRAMGDEHAALGEDALERGKRISAGDHFTRAAVYYHYGSAIWHEDPEFRDETHRLSVEVFRRGGQYLDPPVQRIEAPYEAGGFAVPGNLRVPETALDGSVGDSPLVLTVPGLATTKEEMAAYDRYFLERGMATLAMEGSGQGEVWYAQGISPEYPNLVSAVIDHILELDPEGVDTSTVAIVGISLGGFYAPFSAAYDPRIQACVGVSGAFTVGPISPRDSRLAKEQYLWACKVDSMVEVDRITEQLSLRDVIDDLTVPTLVITGGQDGIVAPAQTERIAEEADDAEYLFYEEGNHVCNNIPYKYRPKMADWLQDVLD